jgi:thiamine-phosphate pyrophosphorylase
VITDWQISDLLDRLEPVLALGPSVAVQHRHPGADDRLVFEEGRALASRCARFGNPLFVNGRLDIALLLDAHLHLPARGMAVGDVRPHLPTPRWVSIAVHDLEEATASRGADLALISPVYEPGSKPIADRPALGPEGFQKLAQVVTCAAFALGGISPSNADQVVGAAGFAAISSVLGVNNPREAAVSLLRVSTAAR